MQIQMEQLINRALAFIGKKFDELKVEVARAQVVKLDVGDSIKQLSTASKQLQEVSDKMGRNESARDLTALRQAMEQVAKNVVAATLTFQQAASKLSSHEQEKTNKLMNDLIGAVRKIKLEERAVDLSGLKLVENAVLQLQTEVRKKDNKDVVSALKDLTKAFKEFKVEIPKQFKLDEMQMKVISRGGGGGATASYASATTVNNTTLTNANTEYSYTFPANTISWTIRARSVSAKLYYAWETGKLPTSGDGSAYLSIHQNFLRSTSNVDYSGRTIYLQSDTAATVVEIESNQL